MRWVCKNVNPRFEEKKDIKLFFIQARISSSATMKEIKKAGYVPIHHIMDLSGKKCIHFPSPEPHERPKANLSNVAFETLLVSKREFGYLVL